MAYGAWLKVTEKQNRKQDKIEISQKKKKSKRFTPVEKLD